MQAYIVKQPIIDADYTVYGYEILYNENAQDVASNTDSSAANTIEFFLSQLSGEKFLDSKLSFLTFTPNLLLRKIPKIFTPEKMVIQIDDSTVIHPLAMRVVQNYRSQGYRIAVKGFQFAARYLNIIETIDYIKLNFSKLEPSSYENIILIGQRLGKKIIAYNVNEKLTYDWAHKMRVDYVQGSYIAQAMSTSIRNVPMLQSNFFYLLIAITNEEPDMDEIERIISRDVSLTFSLIKLVNSSYFALRSSVKSVKQALMVLGIDQLKKWIYLLTFKPEDNDASEELMRISFLRASFCAELHPYAKDLPISKSEAYLMGMFSTLGALMQIPLADALNEMALAEEIKAALTKQEGPCGLLYRLVLSYEAVDWRGIAECAEQLSIPMPIITQKYFECVENVNQTWNDLTSMSLQTP